MAIEKKQLETKAQEAIVKIQRLDQEKGRLLQQADQITQEIFRLDGEARAMRQLLTEFEPKKEAVPPTPISVGEKKEPHLAPVKKGE